MHLHLISYFTIHIDIRHLMFCCVTLIRGSVAKERERVDFALSNIYLYIYESNQSNKNRNLIFWKKYLFYFPFKYTYVCMRVHLNMQHKKKEFKF
jgi:hypothetical protein